MGMVREELDAIKTRCNAATPGPWKNGGYVDEKFRPREGTRVVKEEVYAGRLTSWHLFSCQGSWDTGGLNHNDDAEFIIHARKDIPVLLAEVERLQGIERERDAAVADLSRAPVCYTCLHHATCEYGVEQKEGRAARTVERCSGKWEWRGAKEA